MSEQNQTPNVSVSPAEDNELLSIDEAAQFLGTSKPTLYRVLGQGDIKGLKVGRQWRFRKADLVAYLERSPISVAAAPAADIEAEMLYFLGELGQDAMPPENFEDLAEPGERKTEQLARAIVYLAIKNRASDIHLEPLRGNSEPALILRFRIDGFLQEIRSLPSIMRESLVSQYKKMAEMNLVEKRIPQDGRIPIKYNAKDFDLRVSCLPTISGENIVIRILDRSTVLIGLDVLGLAPEDKEQIDSLIGQPSGMLICTGPTGSGKTTLMYSCLQAIAGVERKTLTVEDPVEFMLRYTTQVQVNKRAGLTFAAALRTFMRQDPDVIYCGEMRDLETLQTAVEASLTGHLVMTTLHTNDAPSALIRMLDMGLEPYLTVATVIGVVASRLCRRICESCKEPLPLPALDSNLGYIRQIAKEGGYTVPPDAVFFRGRGCAACGQRGYKGRLGIYEILTMTPAITEAVLRRAEPDELAEIAVAHGMRTLFADGLRKAVEGQTTLEEILRVASVSL